MSMGRSLSLLLVTALAACATNDAEPGPAFDDTAYLAESDRAGCIDGKCDSSGDWSRGRLATSGLPPLLNGNWDDDTLARWNTQDQGVMLLPLSWVLALEEPDSDRPFLSGSWVTRYGFLPGTRSELNPDGLPVGFTSRLQNGQLFFGFTCAACHTAEIHVNGASFRIAGGQGQEDVVGFSNALADAFKANLSHITKAYRLISRIVRYEGLSNVPTVAREIYDRLKNSGFGGDDGLYPVPSGPSRLDALGRGGNRAFGSYVDARNYAHAQASISLPPLWDSARFDWTNSNGSIHQPLARNTVEALGVGADMVLRGGDGELFDSSVNFDALVWLEQAIRAIDSPVWPDAFGPPAPPLVAVGRLLYIGNCGGCHGELDPQHPNRLVPFPSEFGEEGAIGLKFFNLDDIGTDRTAADSFADRQVYLSPALYDALGIPAGSLVPAVDAFQAATSGVLAHWMDKQGFSDEKRTALTHGRENVWRAIRAYRARPLNGIWSTAPFFHNGSVPNMDQVMRPARQRALAFLVGGNELDPDTLGLNGGDFVYNTALPGNSNAGHSFEDGYDSSRPWTAQNGLVGRALAPAERRAIIEFLKVIEPMPR
jgi:hypothetical protein